jgi:hypothetical protein
MESTLRRMRAEGRTYKECAEAIGVCDDAVMRKAKLLGINKRMNYGSKRGAERVLSSQ